MLKLEEVIRQQGKQLEGRDRHLSVILSGHVERVRHGTMQVRIT
jgi:hypothetical protein